MGEATFSCSTTAIVGTSFSSKAKLSLPNCKSPWLNLEGRVRGTGHVKTNGEDGVLDRGPARAKALRHACNTLRHLCPPCLPSPRSLLTRSRPRSSSLSCRCDRDKVLSCWFQSMEPRFRKWALSSVGSLGSVSTPPQHPPMLAAISSLPQPEPPCSCLQIRDTHQVLTQHTQADV